MEDGRIDRLTRGLYSRKAPDIIDPGRSELVNTPSGPEMNWQAPESSKFDVIAARVAHGAGKHHSLAKKIFGFSLGIFILSILVAGFVLLGGINRVSSKNVDIKVVGPVSVGGGQESSFEIVVTNNNNTDLENVKLTLEYPRGARKAGDLSTDLTSESFNLGSINSGKEATQPISIYLFGEKDEIKQFKATVDYEIKNSNAKFFKEKQYDVSISSAPIIVTSTYPKEVNTNQNIEFRIEVVPNSADAPQSFLVNVSYPFGFTLQNATPGATYGNNTWKFDGLKQGSKRTIILSGVMTGQNNEERVFKVTAGTPSEDDPRQVGVAFVSSDETILVKRPFLGLDLRLDNKNGDVITQGTRAVDAALRVQNNTREQIFNVVVEAKLSGPAFSGENVKVGPMGFFRSVDNTVFWDKRSVSQFSSLQPGESQDLSWDFAPVAYQNFSQGNKPEMYVTIKVTGDRILDSGATERIESTETRTVKIATDIGITQKTVRIGNGITNTGSVPPQANQKTTYTIVWSLSNSFNIASNVVAKATLPSYVEWTNVISPTGEKITYNPDTHEVMWNIGTLSAGSGYGSSPRQAAFQVSFLPSTAQKGTEPALISEVTLSGIDKATGTKLQTQAGAVTTRFQDSSYRINDERVVQ